MVEERVALIVGGSKGLGKMTALSLAKRGFHVIINYHQNSKAANRLVSTIQQFGGKATAMKGDAVDYQQMEGLFADIENKAGRIDVLVHSVGPFIRERKTFYQMDMDEVGRMIDGNLKSALYTTSFALPFMRRQGFGRIIYFGFNRVNELPAWPDRSVYAAAKVALVSFTKTLAVEEAPYGITVNMVCPSDIIGENKEKYIKEVLHVKDKESLRDRPGSGEDVSRVIDFLSEHDSDYITGNVINVSGGLDIIHPVSKNTPKNR